MLSSAVSRQADTLLGEARHRQLEDREHLCLTVTFDHDVVDGAPAARFLQQFKELLESGNGLFEA